MMHDRVCTWMGDTALVERICYDLLSKTAKPRIPTRVLGLCTRSPVYSTLLLRDTEGMYTAYMAIPWFGGLHDPFNKSSWAS